MGVDDPSWKILGASVQLNKKSQLLIQEANLSARLDNINNYPGIKPWIGDPDQWRDVLGSIVGVTLGGQKRRLVRFLFACKADAYKQQLQSIVKDLQAAGTSEVNFHIRIAGRRGPNLGQNSPLAERQFSLDSGPDFRESPVCDD